MLDADRRSAECMSAMTTERPFREEDSPDLPALLRDACSGCEDAWRQLVALYARRVFAMVRSRCHDDDLAEEITQSVFVTISSKLSPEGGYEEHGRFESWLFRITMNRVRDEMRRRKRHAVPTDPAGFGGIAGAEETTRDDDGLDALRNAMGGLSDAERQIIELRHHGQMSFKLIAETLDEPIGTVLARHHRALKKLKRLIEDQASRVGSES